MAHHRIHQSRFQKVTSEPAIPSLRTIVDEVADKIASRFEEALKKALQRRQKDMLLNAAEVLW